MTSEGFGVCDWELERVLKENGGAMAVKNEVGVEGECEA